MDRDPEAAATKHSHHILLTAQDTTVVIMFLVISDMSTSAVSPGDWPAYEAGLASVVPP